MDKKNLALGRKNFILLAAGMLVVMIGFILMGGPGSTETSFNPGIFSATRTRVAPIVCFIGFISIIYAVLRNPSERRGNEKTPH